MFSLSFKRLMCALSLFCLMIGANAADKPADVPVVTIVNFVTYPILDESIRGIKAELQARGYTGNRIRLVEVNANGQMEHLDAIASEVVASHPAVIVPVSTPVTQAFVKKAGPGQAIVFSTVTNPDDVGMAKRPPNVTGVSDAVNYAANIELIRELFPKARTVGMIYNPSERNSQFGVTETQSLVKKNGLTLLLAPVSSTAEVGDAARALAGKAQVFLVGSDNTVASALNALLGVANEKRLPVIASDAGSVEKGALAAVSVDYQRVGREAGRIVAGLLDKPVLAGSVPNVVVKGESLVLNEAAAAKIGYRFPSSVRKRAAQSAKP